MTTYLSTYKLNTSYLNKQFLQNFEFFENIKITFKEKNTILLTTLHLQALNLFIILIYSRIYRPKIQKLKKIHKTAKTNGSVSEDDPASEINKTGTKKDTTKNKAVKNAEW